MEIITEIISPWASPREDEPERAIDGAGWHPVPSNVSHSARAGMRNSLGRESPLTLDMLQAVVDMCVISEQQKKFWEVWAAHVLSDCFAQSMNDGRTLMVSTDMKRIEFRVAAPERLIKDCAKNLTWALGLAPHKGLKPEDPSRRQLKVMDMVMPEGAGDLASLWVKLKGNGTATPGADAGFCRDRHLPWAEADLLLPPVEDVDCFRDYAFGEGHSTSSYGSSLLPWDTEQEVTLELQPMNDAPRKTLLECLFYMKAMGFAKQSDHVRTILGRAKQSRSTVVGSFGPKGLTRLSFILHDPCGIPVELADTLDQTKDSLIVIAAQLAKAINYDFDRAKVEKLCGILQAQPDCLEYAVDQAGVSIGIGFTG